MITYHMNTTDGVIHSDNGVTHGINFAGLPANVYAIHWFGTSGFLEIIDPTKPYHYAVGNTPISDLTPYQSYIAQHATLLAAAQAAPAAPTTPTVPGTQSVIG